MCQKSVFLVNKRNYFSSRQAILYSTYKSGCLVVSGDQKDDTKERGKMEITALQIPT